MFTKKEISQLKNLLKSPPRRKKGRRSVRSVQPVPGAVSTQPHQNAQSRRRRRGKGFSDVSGASTAGMITLSRREFLTTVSMSTTKETVISVPLIPTTAVLPYLYRLYQIYDRVQWESLTIYYRPSVGTTTNGVVSYGIDWNSENSMSSRSQVLSLSPVADHAVWQTTENNPIRTPKDLLQSRKWFTTQDAGDKSKFDLGPGSVIWATSTGSTASVGELWVEYKVRLVGTRI